MSDFTQVVVALAALFGVGFIGLAIVGAVAIVALHGSRQPVGHQHTMCYLHGIDCLDVHADHDSRLNAHADQLADHDERLTGIDQMFTDTEARFRKLEDRIQTLENTPRTVTQVITHYVASRFNTTAAVIGGIVSGLIGIVFVAFLSEHKATFAGTEFHYGWALHQFPLDVITVLVFFAAGFISLGVARARADVLQTRTTTPAITTTNP